jgi:uncharacterized glyoxalase superfamily protein PhnB
MPRLNFVGLVVADIAASLAFYRKLGLAVPPEADREAHVQIRLPDGMTVAWDTVETIRSFDPDWQRPTGGSRVELAFECDSPADVDQVYAELVAAGYEGHHEPWDAFWGQRYATVRDPDGVGVDLYAPTGNG